MTPAAITCAATVTLVAFLPFCSGGIDRRPIEDVSSESVSYQADDGVRIAASWFFPPGETKPPVVILLHEQDGSRAQWNKLIPVLVDKGYAVLAPDLRGFGESDTIIRDGREEPYVFANPVDALLDVAAALKWLEGRNDVDLGRIGMIGARLGADLAYVSSGGFPAVRAAVAITPTPYAPDDPLLSIIQDYTAHDVFIMAGSRIAWENGVTLGIRIQDPGGRRYVDHPDLDGTALMAIDDPIEDILDWFKKRLLTPPTIPPG